MKIHTENISRMIIYISESDIKEFFQLIKGTNKESNILAKVKKKILSSQQER